MSFKNKIITLIIGLTLAFAGSLGSYAYFTSIATATENTIELGEWKNITPKPTDIPKSNKANKPIQKVNKDKVSEKVTTKIKANNSDKKKEQVKLKEEKKEIKQEKNINNTNNKNIKVNSNKEIKKEENKNTNIKNNKENK